MLVLAAPLLPAASADEGSLVMIAAYEQRDYVPGEVLNFSIYVFYKGESVDTDAPPVVTVLRDYSETLGRVPVTASAPGRYDGRYTVLAADATDGWQIYLRAGASYGSPLGAGYAQAATFIYVPLALRPSTPSPAAMKFNAHLMEASDTLPRPGSKLAFQCCVTIDGTPADPQGIRFYMDHDMRGAAGANTGQVQQERVGPGNYVLRYQIPSQNYSDRFLLYGSVNGTDLVYAGAGISLDFYQLIYHELKRNGSRIDYELLVSDLGGNPVNGASVSLQISAGSYTPAQTVRFDPGRTDRSGRLRSFLDLGELGGTAYITGWVNTSKASQRLSASLLLPGQLDEGATPSSGFDVRSIRTEGELRPGATVHLVYQVSIDRLPLADAPVDCYIEMDKLAGTALTPLGVRGSRLVTDAEGLLDLTISFPSGFNSSAQLTFWGPDTGSTYNNAMDVVMTYVHTPAVASPPWANATFSRAEAGSALRATVTGPGLAAASMSWDFDHGASGSQQQAWAAWSPHEWLLAPPSNNSIPLKGRMGLPHQLHVGANLTVHLTMFNSSGEPSLFDYPVRVKSPPEPQAESDLCCIAGAAVLNIALLAFVAISYLGSKRSPPRKGLEDLDVDERISEVMRPREKGPPGPQMALPFKAELAANAECASCGRKIARGNEAYGCVCGKRFHEHCLRDEKKCPNCGRDWTAKRANPGP